MRVCRRDRIVNARETPRRRVNCVDDAKFLYESRTLKTVFLKLVAAVAALIVIVGLDALVRPEFYGRAATVSDHPPIADNPPPQNRPEPPRNIPPPRAGGEADQVAIWVEEMAGAMSSGSGVLPPHYGRLASAAERDPEGVEAALVLLVQASGDGKVRAAAAFALGGVGRTAGVKALAAGARDDLDPRVRRAAIEALGRNPDPAAGAALCEWLARVPDPVGREGVARALGARGDGGAVTALRAALENERSGTVRARLVEALGAIGGTEAQSELAARAAADPCEEVRVRAVRGLAAGGGEAAREALQRAAGHDPSAEVRDTAAAALRELK